MFLMSPCLRYERLSICLRYDHMSDYRYACDMSAYRYACDMSAYRYACDMSAYRYACDMNVYRYACDGCCACNDSHDCNVRMFMPCDHRVLTPLLPKVGRYHLNKQKPIFLPNPTPWDRRAIYNQAISIIRLAALLRRCELPL
jgi:hypothetical protein